MTVASPARAARPPEAAPGRAERTRARILAVALKLFNELGEASVTTTALTDALRISPGNLYYHFSNKDDIVNGLFAQFQEEIVTMLQVPQRHIPTLDDIGMYLRRLFEVAWRYRFLYRDLNHLLERNRTLEQNFRAIFAHKLETARALCRALAGAGQLEANATEVELLAHNLVVIGTYWLSFEYVRNPRHMNEPAVMSAAIARGSEQILAMLSPYLRGASRAQFQRRSSARPAAS